MRSYNDNITELTQHLNQAIYSLCLITIII